MRTDVQMVTNGSATPNGGATANGSAVVAAAARRRGEVLAALATVGQVGHRPHPPLTPAPAPALPLALPPPLPPTLTLTLPLALTLALTLTLTSHPPQVQQLILAYFPDGKLEW